MKPEIVFIVGLMCALTGCSTRIGATNKSNKNYYNFVIFAGKERTMEDQLYIGKSTVLEKVQCRIPEKIKIEWRDKPDSVDKRKVYLSLPDWARGQPEAFVIEIQNNETFYLQEFHWKWDKWISTDRARVLLNPVVNN